jgi:quercetin dioxygenase-like cupin family protein
MAIEHAQHGQVIDLNTHYDDEKTAALVKTEEFEVIRIRIDEFGSLPPHKVDGHITVQCLSGKCTFLVEGEPRELTAGAWLYLEGGAMHSVEAAEAAVLLVTILFTQGS